MRDKLEWIVKRGVKYSILAGYWLLGAIVGAEEAKYDMASLLNRRLEEIIPPDEENPEDFSADILRTFADVEHRRLSDMEREIVDLELEIFKKRGDVAAAPNLTEADQLNEELGFMTRRLVKYRELLTIEKEWIEK